MKENNESDKTSIMNIKSGQIRQNVFGYLKVNQAIKLTERNKILTKNVLEGYSAESASCSYYDYFRYMFFVEQNTEIIYRICRDIFKKDLEQIPKDLIDGLKLKQNINNHNNLDDNNLNKRINSILFACAVPKIIGDIYSINKMHFDNLSKDEVKNLDSDKALQTLVKTILENRHAERLLYLKKFLDETGNEIINRIDCSISWLSLDCYEERFRCAVYYKMVYKLLDKIQNEMFSKDHVTKCERFNYGIGNKIFVSINELDCYRSECHQDNPACLLSNMASMYILEYYRKLASYGYLDILFDGVKSASECDQILEGNHYLDRYLCDVDHFDKHDDLREKLAMSYQRALMRIFEDDKEKFVEHCEDGRIYTHFFGHLSYEIRRIEFWSCRRLAGYIAYWALLFILGVVFSPVGLGALFWFAFTHHIFWLEIVCVIAACIWLIFLTLLILNFRDSIKQFDDNHVTLSRERYNNYLERKYPILNPANQNKFLSDDYYKFREFKTKIINLNQLHGLHKSVNKMLQNENQIPLEIDTNEI